MTQFPENAEKSRVTNVKQLIIHPNMSLVVIKGYQLAKRRSSNNECLEKPEDCNL